MTRIKNRLHSILHANLIPPFEGELFSVAGRVWLETQPLAADERIAIRRYLADLDQRAADLDALDAALAERAMKDERARRLMTLSGVHVTVAMGLLAAIGDITRFVSSEKLVSYLGLNPSVRQSGNRPAQHGRITKQGRSHARAMLVEAAWAASCVLSAYPIAARQAGRGGRHGAQVGGSGLALADQGGRLRLGAPCAAAGQTA
jgi:transposase